MSHIFRRALIFVTDATIGRIIRRRQINRARDLSTDNSASQNHDKYAIGDVAIPSLSQSIGKQHERAVLVDSTSKAFGDECLRLVNIAFHTSQTFSSIMNTYLTISRYIRQELRRQHPEEHFHIIIGENNAFGFAITDDTYFAEIEQEQYRVLIFTTNRSRRAAYTAHDANSEMVLEWKSTVTES